MKKILSILLLLPLFVSAQQRKHGNIKFDSLKVIDQAYGSNWNSNLRIPTMNAIYDKIESLGTIASTSSVLKGNGSGSAVAATLNTDYLSSASTINNTSAPTADFSMNSHKITGLSDGTNANDAVNFSQLSSVIIASHYKAAVQYGTLTALAANTYNNAAGTITMNSVGIVAIDGHNMVLNESVLIKDESTQSHNGIYTMTTEGTGGVAGVFTRRTDFDDAGEITQGDAVSILFGQTFPTGNAQTTWIYNSVTSPTLGTDAITFAQTTAAASIADNAVTNSKLAQMASHTFKGNNTGSTANATDITVTQLTAELNTFSSSLQGLVPASGGSSTQWLNGAGSFTTPTTISGNAGTATILQTARNINGTSFNGSSDITVTAAASTLTGTTLASSITASSLTSFGNSPTFIAPILGTPTSGDFSTGSFTWPTFNQNTSGSAATLTTPRNINGIAFDGSANIELTGSQSSGQTLISNGTNYVAATTRNNWTSHIVSVSNFTTSSTSLVNITGLVTTTLSTSTLYEFEAVLYVNSSSTAGMAVGVQQSGTGSGQIGVWSGTATSATATGIVIASNALNQAGALCVLVNGDGSINIRGFVKTGSSGSPTISLKVLKSTSGTATVYVGSVLRYRQAN